MNIQIFGKSKCFDTKKAERYFKERRIKYQFIDLNRYGISRGELLAGIIGLIPNCASSILLTTLYLQGGMSAGAMLSGLMVGSGVGILVLLRMNRNIRDNLVTIGLLYAFGVGFGMIAGALPIF